MLECRKIRNQISQYIDKELDAKDIDLFEKHIGNCEECRKELQDMLSIVNILQSTEDQDLPEGFKLDFHRRLVEESGKPAGKKKIILGNFGKYAAILSSAAAVLLVAFLFKGVWSNMLDNKSASDASPFALTKAQANADEKMINDNNTAKKFADNYNGDKSTELQIDSSEYSNNTGIITYDSQPTEKKQTEGASGVSKKPGGDVNQDTLNNVDNLKATHAVPAAPTANNTQDAGATLGRTGVALTDSDSVNKNTSEVIMSGMGASDQTENIKRLVADCGGEIVATTVSTAFAAKSVSAESADKMINVKVKNSQYGMLVDNLKANYGSENLIIAEVNHQDTSKKVDELNATLKNLDSRIDESQKNGALPESKELQDLNSQKTAVSKEIESLIDDSDYTYITITIKNIKQ